MAINTLIMRASSHWVILFLLMAITGCSSAPDYCTCLDIIENNKEEEAGVIRDCLNLLAEEVKEYHADSDEEYKKGVISKWKKKKEACK